MHRQASRENGAGIGDAIATGAVEKSVEDSDYRETVKPGLVKVAMRLKEPSRASRLVDWDRFQSTDVALPIVGGCDAYLLASHSPIYRRLFPRIFPALEPS